jgi:radical SAM-linked protein
MKKRLYFDKFGEMKFISHLDMLRFLDRLFKKAHIPVKYSQGFHPRPRMSFGNPISLGTEAYNEVMDIELESPMSNEEILKRVNDASVNGFVVHKVETVDKKSVIAEEFTVMIYEITGDKEYIDAIETILNQNEIVEVKEKNGKRSERNLKERILNFSREGNSIKIDLVNTSPNPFLTMADIEAKDVEIKKLGYKK